MKTLSQILAERTAFQERLFFVVCEAEKYGYAIAYLDPVDVQGAEIEKIEEAMRNAGELHVKFASPYEDERDQQCGRCNSLMRESVSRNYMICDVCGETA